MAARKTFTVLGYVPSRSNPAAQPWEIRKGADGVVYCLCPSWRNSKPEEHGGHKSCRHLPLFFAQVNDAVATDAAIVRRRIGLS